MSKVTNNDVAKKTADEKYVLAMYDIRGKQEYIFRTNKLKEIVGGSWIIRDCFKDYLFPAAVGRTDEEVDCMKGSKGIFTYKDVSHKDDPCREFSKDGFMKHLDEGYCAEVVYDGGGNFFVLFKSNKVFREVTWRFTCEVLKATGTLRILATGIEIENFDHYGADQRKLREKHRMREAEESSVVPWACPPIVQTDRQTSMPLVSDKNIESEEKTTRERLAKLAKFRKEIARINSRKGDPNASNVEKYYMTLNEKIFDHIVEEKGVDSNLAVVYIDGNSMGAKVEKATRGKESYEECVAALREFSAEIEKLYVQDGVDAALGDVMDSQSKDRFRIVVYAGDEINFVVKARDAMDCARNYLEKLKGEEDASACAGIAVFHSHSPYADAYRIAEECCESGKKKMKEARMQCASFIDFHICQGAIGTSLDTIRELENPEGVSRPWLLWSKDPKETTSAITSFAKIESILSLFRTCKISRSNIKGLANAAKTGEVELKMELKRIYAHMDKDLKKQKSKDWEGLFSDPDSRRILYDLAICYDFWFREDNSKKSGTETEGTENE